jgi:hypothetical protein
MRKSRDEFPDLDPLLMKAVRKTNFSLEVAGTLSPKQWNLCHGPQKAL